MSIKKAIFPVAGMGTRFLPATKATPKEMLPLVDKPLVQYVVEEAIEAGIEQIVMVTGRGKTAIEDHFDRSIELELLLEDKGDHQRREMVAKISELCEIIYVRQKSPKGLGHAISCGRHIIGNEPFAVLLGDDIIYHETKPAIGELVTAFEKKSAPIIAVQEVPHSQVSSYGVIDPDMKQSSDTLYKIKSMVEKPPADEAPSNLAIIGRYILTPEIFEHIEQTVPDKKGEIQLTNALNTMLAEGAMYGCKFSGKRYDAGDKLGFLKATVEFALRREDLGNEFRDYLKSLEL